MSYTAAYSKLIWTMSNLSTSGNYDRLNRDVFFIFSLKDFNQLSFVDLIFRGRWPFFCLYKMLYISQRTAKFLFGSKSNYVYYTKENQDCYGPSFNITSISGS